VAARCCIYPLVAACPGSGKRKCGRRTAAARAVAARSTGSVKLAQESMRRKFGIDFASFDAWPDLEMLRLVANCAKHSEGTPDDSCAELRRLRPEFFTRPELDPNYVYPEALQPLGGEGLYVTEEHLRRFVNAMKSFWTDLGAAIRSL
jgi:hypothetical protein